jgi:Icc protein
VRSSKDTTFFIILPAINLLHMLRRDFIGKSLLGLPAFAIKFPKTKDSFRVLFVTDMHLSPAIERSVRCADHLQQYINSDTAIDLVINGGDAVYDVAKLAYPAGEDQWKLVTSFFNGLKKPVHHCLVNHDIYEWELNDQTLTDPQKYKQPAMQHLKMPARYYSFHFAKWKFIVLDSTMYLTKGYKGELDEEQMQWLQNELLKDREKHTCIISHIPIITACNTLYLPWARHEVFPKIAERLSHSDASRIFEETEKTTIPLMLHGHLHMRETIHYKNTTIQTLGAFCADMWKGPFHGFKNSFTLIDFNNNGQAVVQDVDLPSGLQI